MTRKHRILAILVLLLGCLLFAYPVFAQDTKHIDQHGGVVGGHSESIPFSMEVGEMIQGEFIAEREPLRLSVADFSGNSIHNFGECGSRCGFYYAARDDGQHYLVVTHPNPMSVGASGYQIDADIFPSEFPPGTGSGQNVTHDVTRVSTFPAWGIAIIIVVVAIIVFKFTRRRHRPSSRPYDDDSDYYDDDRGPRDIYIHRRSVRCPDCGGTGSVPSLYIPRTRVKCRTCDGTGRIYD